MHFNNGFFALSMLSVALFTTGCPSVPKVVDKVTVSTPDNLGTVDLTLYLANTIQPSFGGSYDITTGNTDIGTAFLQPWAPNAEAQIGFELNTAIFNDPSFNPVDFQSTSTFPNLEPLPSVIGHDLGMFQLKSQDTDPTDDSVDVYLYADIKYHQWFGVAVTFKGATENIFPSNLVLTLPVSTDSAGNPRVEVSAFGPKQGATNYAGIGVFVNVLDFGSSTPTSTTMVVQQASQPVFEGANAAYYKSHPDAAKNLSAAVKAMLESSNAAVSKK